MTKLAMDAIDWGNDESVVRAAIGNTRAMWCRIGDDWPFIRTRHEDVIAFERQHNPAYHPTECGAERKGRICKLVRGHYGSHISKPHVVEDGPLAGEEAIMYWTDDIIGGTSACPICGVNIPHEHAPSEIVEYRNRQKAQIPTVAERQKETRKTVENIRASIDRGAGPIPTVAGAEGLSDWEYQCPCGESFSRLDKTVCPKCFTAPGFPLRPKTEDSGPPVITGTRTVSGAEDRIDFSADEADYLGLSPIAGAEENPRSYTCSHCSGDIRKNARCSNGGICISIEEYDSRRISDYQRGLRDALEAVRKERLESHEEYTEYDESDSDTVYTSAIRASERAIQALIDGGGE